ncbi:MAG: hypothetical protein AB7K24_31155 [Gemmataceae bacterium]
MASRVACRLAPPAGMAAPGEEVRVEGSVYLASARSVIVLLAR